MLEFVGSEEDLRRRRGTDEESGRWLGLSRGGEVTFLYFTLPLRSGEIT
jgi:hypothetical protein